MILHCFFGRHSRSAGRAREIDRKMYSVCCDCGTPLIQGIGRKWRRMTPEEKTELDIARNAVMQNG
jgi:hypothetical protein